MTNYEMQYLNILLDQGHKIVWHDVGGDLIRVKKIDHKWVDFETVDTHAILYDGQKLKLRDCELENFYCTQSISY